MEDAYECLGGHIGWLEHEINHPLPWQDWEGCQEVVSRQVQLVFMREERRPSQIWNIQLLAPT